MYYVGCVNVTSNWRQVLRGLSVESVSLVEGLDKSAISGMDVRAAVTMTINRHTGDEQSFRVKCSYYPERRVKRSRKIVALRKQENAVVYSI